MKTLWLPAPAKLNLFLHVVGRRADGYHELQTLFQLIDLCDEVCIECSARVDAPSAAQVDLLPWSEGPRQGNLIVRAAESLLAACGPDATAGVRVRVGVRKRIPQGGLGGGSSDAASTLLGLNALLGNPVDVARLAALGANLGADVPVFVHGNNACAEGIGERLTPVDLPAAWYLIVAPGCEVPTAEVFGHVSLTRNTPLIRMRGPFGPGVRNDCEALVRQLYPEVDRALRWLSVRGAARLTGTGGCVFAAFDSQEQATLRAAEVPSHWQAFVARGLPRSPVHGLLA